MHPSLSAEEAKTLDPYITLVRRLASFAGQVTEDEISGIHVTFAGEAMDLSHAPLVQTAVQEALAPKLSSINMVNALQVAKERGISVKTTTTETCDDYATLVGVELTTPSMTRSVKGTLVAGKLPRLVEVKGISVETDLTGDMIYVTNKDKPGLIGSVGSVCAREGINIATFHLGRAGVGADAVAIVGLDGPVDPAIVAELKGLEHIERVIPLKFEA